MNNQSEKLKVKGEKYKICAADFEGITLVALVITIILLIILAGVSINAVMNGGLITNAKDAKNNYTQAKKEEESKIQSLDSQIMGLKLGKVFNNANSTYKCTKGIVTGIELESIKVVEMETILGDDYTIFDKDGVAIEDKENTTVKSGMIIKDNETDSEVRIVIYGDISGSGKYDADNVIMLMQMIDNYTGKEYEDWQIIASDLNDDGKINYLEKNIILQAATDIEGVIDQTIEPRLVEELEILSKKDYIDEYMDNVLSSFKNTTEINWSNETYNNEYMYVIYVQENSLQVKTFLDYLQNDTATIIASIEYDSEEDIYTSTKLQDTDYIVDGAVVRMKIYGDDTSKQDCIQFKIK